MSSVLQILVDENIPDAVACFSQFGAVTPYHGRELKHLGDAEVLITRSVTRVDKALCAHSKLRFVGSTTIGTDHLDTSWLASAGIAWCHAPGSNANSVADYVMSALATLKLARGAQAGIVGYGNVGRRVAQRLCALGFNCRAYDPFLQRADIESVNGVRQSNLLDVLDCDVLCLHAPLTLDGEFPTHHMLDASQLAGLRKNAIVLNAGRGGVLATEELIELKRIRPDIKLVLDVWENEPDISSALLAVTTLATPHIAGYSVDGKRNGLRQVAHAYADFSGRPLKPWAQSVLQVPVIHRKTVDSAEQAILKCYDIQRDDAALRSGGDSFSNSASFGKNFDKLRRLYPQRRELQYCDLVGFSDQEKAQLTVGAA